MKLLKIKDLKNELYVGDFGDCFVDYNEGYVCDIISEIADNNISTYSNDLLEWAKGNSSYIEEAVLEFGVDEKNFDFFKLIQQGQYIANEQELYNNLEDSLKFFMYDFIEKEMNILEITEKQNDDLLDFNFDDNNEQLDNLIEHIKNILKETEEEKKV